MSRNDLKEKLDIEVSTLLSIQEALNTGNHEPESFEMALYGVISRLADVTSKI